MYSVIIAPMLAFVNLIASFRNTFNEKNYTVVLYFNFSSSTLCQL